MNRLRIFVLATFFASCGGNKGDTSSMVTSDSTDVKRVLYEQVMDIHDEVMPKIGDIEKFKQRLKDQIAKAPNMVPETRKQLERRISNLDSVGKMMWNWMHEFNMPADSVDAETYREYMEGQMEKVKKVREAMLEIIASESDSTKRVN